MKSIIIGHPKKPTDRLPRFFKASQWRNFRRPRAWHGDPYIGEL